MGITNTAIWGFDGAIRGMRNPMNSHHLSDSETVAGRFVLGDKDFKLATNLIKAGSEHCKFLRFIHVQADFTFPRYFWAEADTYKFIEKNSESTMHKLLSRKTAISGQDFEFNQQDTPLMQSIISQLENMRQDYQQSKSGSVQNELLLRAKQILPEGFLQTRTIDTNYQQLWAMYQQRVITPHRLRKEWVDTFGGWCENLLYFREFFLEGYNGKRD